MIQRFRLTTFVLLFLAFHKLSAQCPIIDFTAMDEFCSMDDGLIDITVTLGVEPYTYLWSNGEMTQDISGLDAGNYSVTVTDANGCTDEEVIVIIDQSPPVITHTKTNELCKLEDGAIDITVTDGAEPYTYLWNTGETTEDIENLGAAVYSVTVTDANGCSTVELISISSNNPPVTINATIVPNTSCDPANGNGSITLTVDPYPLSPAGTPYIVTWSNGETGTLSISGLVGSGYFVDLDGGGVCDGFGFYVVEDLPADPPNLDIIAQPSDCGLDNGSAEIAIFGGLAPYSILWSNGATTSAIDDLAIGTFSVTVTDDNNCTTETSIEVLESDNTFDITGFVVANTSCEFQNGSIDIDVNPLGTYDYEWSNGETTEDLSELAEGTYAVTVTNDLGCSSIAEFEVSDFPSLPIVSYLIVNELCNLEDGTIDITVTDGTGPYTYLWSTGEVAEDIENLGAAMYSVTVTDANGCNTVEFINVSNSNPPVTINAIIVPNTSCDPDNGNGSITITVDPYPLSPAGTPYIISWSNGETNTLSITGLIGDLYQVDLDGDGQCDMSEFFIVEDMPLDPPSMIIDAEPADCGNDNGTASVSISGGLEPYTILWSNGGTSTTITDLPVGAYSVTVTDANSCSNETSVVINESDMAFDVTGLVIENTSCAFPNGSIDITIIPAGAYTYLWSNGQTTEDIQDLTSGNYMVTVSAGVDCDFIFDFDVQSISNSPIIVSELTSAVCGKSNGQINLTISGGEQPYSFDWSHGATSEDLTGILAGDYFVTVTDAQGCSTIGNFEVEDAVINIDITGTTTANSSCVENNGSIAVDVLPAGSYTYLWSNGAVTEDINNLAEGIYSVTVTISGICFEESTFVVQNQSSTLAVDGTVNNVLCFGENTGSISVDFSGGVAPYNYEWLPSISGNPEDPNNLSVGDYSVVVTDASDCQATQNFTISGPATAIQLSCTQSQNVSMMGMTDGQAIVNISGGTSPYSISWTPGASQSNLAAGDFIIDDLAESNYDVIVTDANDCVSICNFSITSDDCPEGSIAPPDFISCLDIQIELIATSTVVDSDYSWSTLDGNILGPTNISTITVDQGGQYMLIVEASDCSDTSFVTVFDLSTELAAMINPTTSITLNCTQESINLEGSVDGADLVDYIWYYENEVISTEQSISLDQPGTYTLTTIDQITGCEDSEQILIDEDIVPPILNVDTPPMLNCLDTLVSLTGTSVSTGVDLMWIYIDNLDSLVLSNNGEVNVDKPGTYHLIGIASNGCLSSTSVVVQQDVTSPEVNAGEDQILDCNHTSVELVGSSNISSVDYLWSTNDPNIVIDNPTNMNLVVDQAGIYSLAVTNTINSCSAFDEVLVAQNGNILLPELEIIPPNCFEDQNGSILVNANSMYGPYLYSLDELSNGDNNFFNSLGAGDYELVILDGQGCTWNSTVNIPAQESISVDIGTDLEVVIGDYVIVDLVHSVLDNELDTIIWFPSDLINCSSEPCTTIAFTAEEQITIGATVIDIYGCEGYAELVVNVGVDSEVYVANVFSPNGDGNNDNLTIFSNNEAIEINEFRVFDRWGESVFQSFDFSPNDSSFGWDGNFHGQPVNPDVYVWYAEVKYEDGQVQILTGDITVVK